MKRKIFFVGKQEILRGGIAAAPGQFRRVQGTLTPDRMGIMHYIGKIILFDAAAHILFEQLGQLAAAERILFRQRIDPRIVKRRTVQFFNHGIQQTVDPFGRPGPGMEAGRIGGKTVEQTPEIQQLAMEEKFPAGTIHPVPDAFGQIPAQIEKTTPFPGGDAEFLRQVGRQSPEPGKVQKTGQIRMVRIGRELMHFARKNQIDVARTDLMEDPVDQTGAAAFFETGDMELSGMDVLIRSAVSGSLKAVYFQRDDLRAQPDDPFLKVHALRLSAKP